MSGVLTFVDAEICRCARSASPAGASGRSPSTRANCGGILGAAGRRARRLPPSRHVVRRELPVPDPDSATGDRDFGNYDAFTTARLEPRRPAGRLVRRLRAAASSARSSAGDGGSRSARSPTRRRGSLVHAEGRRLVLGTTTLLRAGGRIVYAQFANDGAVVVLATEGALERHETGEPPCVANLPTTGRGAARRSARHVRGRRARGARNPARPARLLAGPDRARVHRHAAVLVAGRRSGSRSRTRDAIASTA